MTLVEFRPRHRRRRRVRTFLRWFFLYRVEVDFYVVSFIVGLAVGAFLATGAFYIGMASR